MLTLPTQLGFSALRSRLTARTAPRRLCPSPLSQMQNVPRRIFIAIEEQTALMAMVDANGERLSLSRLAPATGTDLRRSARVHRSHGTPGAFSLDVQTFDELAPPCVMHALGEATTGEPTDVQVFDCNVVVLPHQMECGLKREVSPRRLDAPMLPGERPNHLSASGASLRPLADSALCALQLGLRNAKVSRIGDCGSVAQCEERSEPDINADAFSGQGQRPLGNIVATERHPPITASIAAKVDGLDATFNRAREEQPSRSDSLHCDLPAPELPAGPYRECQTVIARPRFEARVTAPPEESVKGAGDTGYGICQNFRANRRELGSFRFHCWELPDLVEAGDALSTHAPRIPPFLECGVIELATQGKLRLSVADRRGWELRLESVTPSHPSI